MRFIKGVLYLFIIVVGLIFVFGIFGGMSNDDEEKLAIIEKKHCELDWETANDSIKEVTLNEFIDNGGMDPVDGSFKTPGMVAAELLPDRVKYPETIKIDDKDFEGWIYFNSGYIEDLKKGVVKFTKGYTAKNKLNMDVRGSFTLTAQYQAGCKNFKLLDFQVE